MTLYVGLISGTPPPLAGYRVGRVIDGIEVPPLRRTTYYYLTAGGTHGSTTDRASIPAGARVYRRPTS